MLGACCLVYLAAVRLSCSFNTHAHTHARTHIDTMAASNKALIDLVQELLELGYPGACLWPLRSGL